MELKANIPSKHSENTHKHSRTHMVSHRYVGSMFHEDTHTYTDTHVHAWISNIFSTLIQLSLSARFPMTLFPWEVTLLHTHLFTVYPEKTSQGPQEQVPELNLWMANSETKPSG